jgi:hypothetical protein
VTHDIINLLVLPTGPGRLLVPFDPVHSDAIGLFVLSTVESDVCALTHVFETLRSIQLLECGVLLLGIGCEVRGERKENGSYVFEVLAVVHFDDDLNCLHFGCRKLVDGVVNVTGVGSGDEIVNLTVLLLLEVCSGGSNILENFVVSIFAYASPREKKSKARGYTNHA